MVSKTKAKKSTVPPGNLIITVILFQTILNLRYALLLGGFELGDEVLAVYSVDAKCLE